MIQKDTCAEPPLVRNFTVTEEVAEWFNISCLKLVTLPPPLPRQLHKCLFPIAAGLCIGDDDEYEDDEEDDDDTENDASDADHDELWLKFRMNLIY